MTVVRQPLLSPIRFHDPSMEFDNETNFQNPDNRVSTGYDWENVKPVPYALPIPRVWPEGQPGIDFMMNATDDTIPNLFYATLYDANDNAYKSLHVDSWEDIDSGHQYHVWMDGNTGAGIEDGYYTIKIFASDDDELLLESEMLLIADWFVDTIPVEFWNFENDFGIVWNKDELKYSVRIMAPIRMFDPVPQFEKETYKNDPGILTTLRTIVQRIFNFDSHPIPSYLAEQLQFGFACSELYLDRIKINAEEIPDAELYEGTNLKYLSGQATLVDFNNDYVRELVDTVQTDQSIEWASDTYATATITGNSIVVNTASVASLSSVSSDDLTIVEDDLILIKVTLTDQAGDSDFPGMTILGQLTVPLEWGINWLSYRVGSAPVTKSFSLFHLTGKAVYTAVIEVYKFV